jgi:hypothetical protein
MTEEIFGIDISAMDAARIENRFIRKDWIDIERALMTGKWFDYRFMSPVAATYLFAHEFKKAYKLAYRKNIDTTRGEYVRPLPDDLFDIKGLTTDKLKSRKRMISGIWRARQVADAMGVPYDIYLASAFHWTLRYWNQNYLPRPQHLYTDLVTDRTAIDWVEHQKVRFHYSKNPGYTNAKYVDLKVQNDHHEYLFEQIANRGNRPELLAAFIDEDLIPLEKINSRLGSEIGQRAAALATNQPAQQRYN